MNFLLLFAIFKLSVFAVALNKCEMFYSLICFTPVEDLLFSGGLY